MKIFPVVHLNDSEQAYQQSRIALEEGADGVYLIDHMLHDERLTLDTLTHLKKDDPNNFVGVNFLHLSVDVSYALFDEYISDKPSGYLPNSIWADDAKNSRLTLKEIRQKYQRLSRVALMGGISFKYTKDFTEDPEKAQREVRQFQDRVDVITTSGSSTGSAPTVGKIRAMKRMADRPIAIASGIDNANIYQFLDLVDIVLVASSIETESYSGIFDKRKLRELISIAHTL